MVPGYSKVNYQISTEKLEYLPRVLVADAHDSETQLETAKIVPQHALDPVLCHCLGRLCILLEANLERLIR